MRYNSKCAKCGKKEDLYETFDLGFICYDCYSAEVDKKFAEQMSRLGSE